MGAAGYAGRMRILFAVLLLAAFFATLVNAQDWEVLYDGKNLDAWEVRGEGIWSILPDGTLLGEREHKNAGNPFGEAWPVGQKEYRGWLNRQSWLYTKREFGEFDLHLEYLIPPNQNSGVSIRDQSRAHWVIGEPDSVWTPKDTAHKGSPAHVGYEIQIIDPDEQKYPSGSVYLFEAAKTGVQKKAAWNSMDIESRNDRIRVRINGVLVAESAGDPARSKVGPIGFQLHDQFTFVMFRHVRIKTVPPHGGNPPSGAQ